MSDSSSYTPPTDYNYGTWQWYQVVSALNPPVANVSSFNVAATIFQNLWLFLNDYGRVWSEILDELTGTETDPTLTNPSPQWAGAGADSFSTMGQNFRNISVAYTTTLKGNGTYWDALNSGGAALGYAQSALDSLWEQATQVYHAEVSAATYNSFVVPMGRPAIPTPDLSGGPSHGYFDVTVVDGSPLSNWLNEGLTFILANLAQQYEKITLDLVKPPDTVAAVPPSSTTTDPNLTDTLPPPPGQYMPYNPVDPNAAFDKSVLNQPTGNNVPPPIITTNVPLDDKTQVPPPLTGTSMLTNQPPIPLNDSTSHPLSNVPLIPLTSMSSTGLGSGPVPIVAPTALASRQGTELLNPDGTPVLGPDGKPLFTTEATPVIDSHGNPLLGPGGKPILTSAGQQLFDSNGKPVLGPDGKPMFVTEGTPILGPDNLPLTGTNGQTLFTPFTGSGLETGFMSSTPGMGFVAPVQGSSLFDGGAGIRGLQRTGVAAGGLTGETAALGRFPATSSEMANERIATSSAEPLMGEAVGAGEAGGAGPGYFPPMGGMGGMGSQGERPQERVTWLVEDEEVWGADPTAAPAVLGRA